MIQNGHLPALAVSFRVAIGLHTEKEELTKVLIPRSSPNPATTDKQLIFKIIETTETDFFLDDDI